MKCMMKKSEGNGSSPMGEKGRMEGMKAQERKKMNLPGTKAKKNKDYK